MNLLGFLSEDRLISLRPVGARLYFVTTATWSVLSLWLRPRPTWRPSKTALEQQLKELADNKGSLIQIVEGSSLAEWTVELNETAAYLSPRTGRLISPENGQELAEDSESRYRHPNDDELALWLEETLQKVAKASNLIKMATGSSPVLFGDSNVKVELEMLRYKEPGQEPEIVKWEDGVHEDDVVAFRAKNLGRLAVDVTMLFIDENFGIYDVFPKHGFQADNRIAPQRAAETRPTKVTPASSNEYMVVIAVQSNIVSSRQYDFSWLAQPAISQVRGERGTPLERLMEKAVFAEGTTRGLKPLDIGSHAVRAISWKVLPQLNPKDE